MALVKKENLPSSEQKRVFKDHIEAQCIFKDIKKNDDERLEALN